MLPWWRSCPSPAAALEVHVLRAGPGLPRAPLAEDGGGTLAQRLRLRAAREGGAAARGARLAGVQRGRGDGRGSTTERSVMGCSS